MMCIALCWLKLESGKRRVLELNYGLHYHWDQFTLCMVPLVLLSCPSQHPLALSVEVFCADCVATHRITTGKTAHTCSLKRETTVGRKKLSVELCDPKAKPVPSWCTHHCCEGHVPIASLPCLPRATWCGGCGGVKLLLLRRCWQATLSPPHLPCAIVPHFLLCFVFVECLKPTSLWFFHFRLRKWLSSDLPRVSCNISCAHSEFCVCHATILCAIMWCLCNYWNPAVALQCRTNDTFSKHHEVSKHALISTHCITTKLFLWVLEYLCSWEEEREKLIEPC